MAIEIIGADGAVIERDQLEDQDQPLEGETPEAELETEASGAAAELTADDEVIISLGEESPPEDEQEQQNAPAWVKDLRQKQRETAKENRELKQRLEAAEKKAAPVVDTLGAKPTMADFDFDEDAFAEALDKYNEKKRTVEAAAQQRQKAEQDLQTEYNGKVKAYQDARTTLKVPDFEDAEAAVLSNFNQVQQAVMVKAPDSVKLVYAVGKNKTELARLAAIKDPIDFALAVGALGTKLKETPRKAPPPPENKVKSTGGNVAAVDATLDKLRADAVKSGDMSKVMEYKRSQKKAA